MPIATSSSAASSVEDRQLALLMDRERREIETLVIGPRLHDVAHVPFADVYGVVASFREHLGQRHLLARQTEAGDVDRGIAHTVCDAVDARS